MNIIIPLGGIGKRFKDNNYNLPKQLINVMGKPILYWLLDNLNISKNDKIIIPYNKELLNYNFEDRLKKDYDYNFVFFILPKHTQGAAETLYLALKELNLNDEPIICLDGDNFYTVDILEIWKKNNSIFVFEDFSDKAIYSYVKYDNKIIDIQEKNKISNLACSGGYCFDSIKILLKYCKKILDNKIKQKNEYYTSTIIKEMIKDNYNFSINKINTNNYICLGTPLQIRLFCNNIPKINALSHKEMIKKYRYCFDFDNTLVTFPQIKGDYTTVKPIQKNINYLKYLKKLGNTIIIYTARRMKTHNGNNGKLLKDIGKLTFDTLDKFNIPYDEIYFGKPYADYYIDDLAISSYSDLEKSLGYYQTSIDPRNFNSIKCSSINILIKKSDDLSGEINYYNNMPNQIKDMFPLMIDHDVNNKWYKMEKVIGIPISKLYLSEELTIEQFKHILGSINRIHECKINKNNINIYSNYCLKLKQRYKNYDYSKYKNSEEIYQQIYTKMKNYENEHLGINSVIHGDPVFTNILINSFGKIKFIDMRGKLGDKLSIQGDIFYDYAKIYQSLIGYDEILEDKIIDNNYKKKMILFFENYFIEKFNQDKLNYLKYITKLLFFTLIPLHNNDKCKLYFQCIT